MKIKSPMMQGKHFITFYFNEFSTVGWGCKIYRLHLCRGVKPTCVKCPKYDTKPFDGEAPVLEFWGIRSHPFIAISARSTLT